jgi:hypothetical protein
MNPDPPVNWTPRSQPLGQPAAPVPISPPPYPPTYSRPPKKRTGLIVGLVAIGLAALLAAGTGAWYVFLRTSPPKQAITACEAGVRSLLKAPATARFSGESASPSGAGGYDVVGNVDAENGFSALVRNTWDCYAVKRNGAWDVRARIDSN